MDRDRVLVIRRTRGRAAAWTIGALALAGGCIGYAMRGEAGPILLGGLGAALFLSAAVLR
jgi:uncharacterized membrane protein (UPF0136 family)